MKEALNLQTVLSSCHSIISAHKSIVKLPFHSTNRAKKNLSIGSCAAEIFARLCLVAIESMWGELLEFVTLVVDNCLTSILSMAPAVQPPQKKI
jgi:hypothetical protein